MIMGSVFFETRHRAFGNNTGIEEPPEVIDQLESGKSPAVVGQRRIAKAVDPFLAGKAR